MSIPGRLGSPSRWLRAGGVALGILALSFIGSGCGSDSNSSSLTGPESEGSNPLTEELLELGEVTSLSADLQTADQMDGVAERGSPFGDLGLTQEQMAAIRTARAEFRAAVAALIEEYGPDPRDHVEFMEELQALRDELAAAIAEILTPEQLALLEELRLAQFIDRVEHLIERIEAKRDRVIAFLDAEVDLTQQQEADIAAIFDSRVAEAQAVVDGLEAGTLTLPEAKEELTGFLRGIADEVEAVLTPEQLDMLSGHDPAGRPNDDKGPRG